MQLSARFKLFKEAFPLSELNRTRWERIVHWAESSKELITLDMNMFPDGLETLAWEHAATKNIIFCETHRKLSILSLGHTFIKTVDIPRKLKKLREVYLHNMPVTTFTVGGSKRTIEVLEIYPSTGRNKIKVPNSMRSLKTLGIGANSGPVILPKTAPALEFLDITINVGSSSMRIPSAYDSLKDITVRGDYGGILIPKGANSIETMELKSSNSKFDIPNVDGMSEVRLETFTTGKIDIPEKWGSTLKVLHIDAPNCKSMTLPKSLEHLMSINLNVPLVKSVELPEDCNELREMICTTGDILVKGTVHHLHDLLVSCTSIKLMYGKTAGKIRHLRISNKAKVSIGLPKEMLYLETLMVNPQRVRFKNINTPKLGWYVKKRWGNRKFKTKEG